MTQVILTASGAGTWTVPADFTFDHIVHITGAGGRGGTGSASQGAGGGGGGGHLTLKRIAGGTLGATVPFYIGSSFTGNTVANRTQWFSSNGAGAYYYAETGASVPPSTGGAGGNAGVNGSPTILYSTRSFVGGNGGQCAAGGWSGGGGGGAAGPYGNGANGGNTSGTFGGGGGGAANGGFPGSAASGAIGATGGNNRYNLGGGVCASPGPPNISDGTDASSSKFGGGAGGSGAWYCAQPMNISTAKGGRGSTDELYSTAQRGPGGGGGGGGGYSSTDLAFATTGGDGVAQGGAGGGGGRNSSSTPGTWTGGNGQNGLIVIIYGAVINFNMPMTGM